MITQERQPIWFIQITEHINHPSKRSGWQIGTYTLNLVILVCYSSWIAQERQIIGFSILHVQGSMT